MSPNRRDPQIANRLSRWFCQVVQQVLLLWLWSAAKSACSSDCQATEKPLLSGSVGFNCDQIFPKSAINIKDSDPLIKELSELSINNTNCKNFSQKILDSNPWNTAPRPQMNRCGLRGTVRGAHAVGRMIDSCTDRFGENRNGLIRSNFLTLITLLRGWMLDMMGLRGRPPEQTPMPIWNKFIRTSVLTNKYSQSQTAPPTGS